MSIRVLIVDDSALIRQLLTEILGSDPGIEVVGVAADPFVAREKIKALDPDVITLDVEMPRMDGLKFLGNLMRLRPMPVVMVSTLTEQGAEVTLAALELGAFDFIAKPKLDVDRGLRAYASVLIEKVKAAAVSRPRSGPTVLPAVHKVLAEGYRTTDRLIAIGSSAGGTEALRVVLAQMPPDAPAVVMAQHIPESFSSAFAQRLDRSSPMQVRQAEDGDAIVRGHAYLAPGGRHLEVHRDGARWVCRLTDADPVNRHRPSVDVLFESVARAAGRNAIGAILTGMGNDGARGLLTMREKGAPTFAQDEASSVVWGMPGSAVRLGAVQGVLPLDQIAARLLAAASH